MSYVIAWFLVGLATVALALLVYFPLRRRKLLALLLIALGSFWALWPISFEDGHLAPLFVVFVFHVFFEPDIEWGPVAFVGFLGTLGILGSYVAILVINKAFGIPRSRSSGDRNRS